MPLTKWERKERLGHGAITKIAKKKDVSISHVSKVVNGDRRDPRIEREVARRLDLSLTEVFGPEYEPQHAGAR